MQVAWRWHGGGMEEAGAWHGSGRAVAWGWLWAGTAMAWRWRGVAWTRHGRGKAMRRGAARIWHGSGVVVAKRRASRLARRGAHRGQTQGRGEIAKWCATKQHRRLYKTPRVHARLACRAGRATPAAAQQLPRAVLAEPGAPRDLCYPTSRARERARERGTPGCRPLPARRAAGRPIMTSWPSCGDARAPGCSNGGWQSCGFSATSPSLASSSRAVHPRFPASPPSLWP